jgi:hypothetical protein
MRSEETMTEEREALGVKEAVQIATNALRDLYDNVELRDLLLEEVERSGRVWQVTLGFTRPGRGQGIGAIMVPQRAYKRIRIDAETGEFLGMEIRQLPSPLPSEESGSIRFR